MNERNTQVSEQAAKRKCARGCDRPATHVIEWRHQDGDRERRVLCQEHAVEDQKYWSAMEWDAGVEVSRVDDWDIALQYGSRITRATDTRTHIVIKFNTVRCRETCPLCGNTFKPQMMCAWPFLEDSWRPICERCATKYGRH